jgi:hypothetical protein
LIFPLLIFPDIEYDFQRNLLNWYEIPLVIALFFLINKWVNHKNSINYQSNFKLFINLKLLGAVLITLIFNLYYSGGDSSAFFNDGRLLNKIMIEYPSQGFRMLMASGNPKTWPEDLESFTDGFRFFYPENTWLICKISCVLQFITFRSMLATSMLFGFFSARIIWRFYKLICTIYPMAENGFRWSILFVPNLLLWGSGIFKDTVTFACLLTVFCCVYNLIVLGESKLKNFFILLFSGYILFVVKSYILISFVGSLFIWLPFVIQNKIENTFFKTMATPLIFASIFFGLIASYGALSDYIEEFAVDTLLETVKNTGSYLKYVSELQDGSSYDIGEMEPTITGMITKVPAASNVTLFRPYVWESKKPIILFAALESFAILLFSLFVIIKLNPFKFILGILKDPLLLAFFVFTIIFATFVGVSSFNFGTLTRYRIPCIPFYLIILSVLYYKSKKPKTIL